MPSSFPRALDSSRAVPDEPPLLSTSPAEEDGFPLVLANTSKDDSLASSDSTDATVHDVTLSIGNRLQLTMDSSKAVDNTPEDPVPLKLQSFRRSPKERAESIALPRHINKLFHKIIGWSNEAVEIDKEHPLVTDEEVKTDPLLPQRRLTCMKRKMQYGVLLEDFEKDKFAVENHLKVAGEKFEKKFLEWEGMKVLDTDAAKALEEVRESKGSIILPTANTFRVPQVNHDPCPGCGATLQDKDENLFGYVRRNDIEKYVQDEANAMTLRREYADRMAELQRHWETNGRRVGEEWLDFMTQEEFDAIYKYQSRAFVCHRCHALENLGVEGRRKVMSAPDFTEQLRALKEKRCVVVLVVDVTDFPGSMVYDLPGLISMNNKVIIAANKCDCIRMRSFQYDGKQGDLMKRMTTERYIRKWITDMAVQFGLPRHNIEDVIPVSARRGWNMSQLIRSIERTANLDLRQPHKPLPTYFVGVANVGKSSVINAIAHHLYVPQPPHPQSKKVYYTKTDKQGKERVFWRWYTPPNVNRAEMQDIPSRHTKTASKLMTVSSLPGTTVATNAVKLSLTNSRGGAEDSAQIYDTPGILPHWHQSSPLTLYQMRRTLFYKYRNPTCFLLLPGHTLFLGGLAAIDVVKGCPSGVLMLVYTSAKVKNAVVKTEVSDQYWLENIGRMLDPPGSIEQVGEARLTESKSYLFECYGKHRLRPKADVYVCGLGWVAFCTGSPADVVLRVRTLPGVVHGVREPLRPKDLRGWNRWPKLTNKFKVRRETDSVDTVIRLTAKELTTDENQEKTSKNLASGAAQLHLVPKAQQPKHTAAAPEPFAEVLSELEHAGKL